MKEYKLTEAQVYEITSALNDQIDDLEEIFSSARVGGPRYDWANSQMVKLREIVAVFEA